MPKTSNIIKSITTLFITCLLLPGLISRSHAQQSKITIFKIVHLPRKTAYSKDKLNEEIAKAKDKEAVRKIIRLKNFPSAQLIIQIQQGNNKYVWWTINTTTGYEREDNDIILQSKSTRSDESNQRPGDSTIRTVYAPSEFKKIFRDTLALLDPLYIESFLDHKAYPADGFIIKYTCQQGKSAKEYVPYSKHKMIFSSKLLKPCAESITPVSLYNKKKSADILSSFHLVFLSDEKKETLLEVANFYRKTQPDAGPNDIADLVSAYSSREYGTPYYPQLMKWLRKNMK